jgi:hypothetical protein
MGLDVPFVGDGDDGSHVCVFEDEVDQGSHGFGAQPNALRITGYGEADLGPLVIGADADPCIANQFVRGTTGDPKLDPSLAGEEVYLAHLINEPRRLMVRLRFPALVPADLWIMPIGLKPGEIDEFESPEHDSAAASGKGI